MDSLEVFCIAYETDRDAKKQKVGDPQIKKQKGNKENMQSNRIILHHTTKL